MNYKKILKTVGIAAVVAVLGIGCVEKPDDGDSTGTDGSKYEKPDDGDSTGTDGSNLVLRADEAWINDDGDTGYIFRANNEVVYIVEDGGTWYYEEKEIGTWSANGNNITITYNGGYVETGIYTISGNKLMITYEGYYIPNETGQLELVPEPMRIEETYTQTTGLVIEKRKHWIRTINVYVRDGGGNDSILTGATVTLLNGTAPKTVEQGKGVTFTNLVVGEYAIRAYKSGYTGYFINGVDITNEVNDYVDSLGQDIYITRTVNAILYPLTAKLVGTIYCENNGKTAPAAGVPVVLTLNDQYIESRTYETQTDAEGVFKFDSLPTVGTAYKLTALEFQGDGGVMFQQNELATDKLLPLIPNASANLPSWVAYQDFEKTD